MGIAAACTGGSAQPRPTSTTALAPPTIPLGGSITVGTGGEPGCMDWISTCAGSTWGVWTVETNTLPRAYDFTSDGEYKPSILLTGEALVRMSPAQVVTYRLNPRAVWSDGQPITSQDFQYTWDQIAHGTGIADPSGYSDIASVDDSNPGMAVVTFSQPYADWRKLFGGPYGLLPSHLLQGHDRDALMKDGYGWSGGPWELAASGWNRGQSITLVPNPNYWGKKPDLASVTFRLFADQGSELQAYQSGQVTAAYPEPGSAAGYKTLPTTQFSVTPGLDYEALWFNLARAPLDAKAVRQAIGYALDRTAIAIQLIGSVDSSVEPLQDLLTPAYGSFYTDAFAKYQTDSAKVAQLLHGAGWAKGTDGMWAKGGHPAVVDLKVAAGGPGVAAAAQLIATDLKTAGFSVSLQPASDPATLYTHDVPTGVFAAAVYPVDLRRVLPSGSGTPLGVPGISDNDPGQCALFCSTSIPTAANSHLGFNYTGLADPTLDRYLLDLQANSSSSAQVSDADAAASILADDVPGIPLAALPDVLVVNTAKLGVEGGVFKHNLAYGPFADLNEWYLR